MDFDFKSIFNKASKTIRPKSPSDSEYATSMEDFLKDSTYSVRAENWYTAKPYGFKIRMRDKEDPITMFLPISPSNLTISSDFATNIIPTLYGTVEEHSDVRYFDIVIEGTTGMAPQFVDPSMSEPDAAINSLSSSIKRNGRSSFPIIEGISLGGFFSKTLSMVNQISNKASDIRDGAPKAKNGVSQLNSGYVAFHNLYRVLLKYKKDAAGVSSTKAREPNRHPLIFFNYKDNNQYNVAIRSFTMRRSAENPMLYFYSIQMRGYNMTNIGDDSKINDNEYSMRLANLGLNGVDSSSMLGDFKDKISNVKSVVGSAVGGIGVLGR